MRNILILCLAFLTIQLLAQPTQTIHGTVVDNASGTRLPSATIILLNTNPLIGKTADTAGNFTIPNVPVGRYDLKVSLIGYEPAILREISINSAKQIILTIPLKESASSLGEIVIKPNVNKEQPLNSMATVSGRMFSVEEAKRYAGGFDDPARLASSFAGVSSNSSENGIIVRGNAPKSLQWKMEGIEIPNPNHFGDLKSYGGGVFTALSSQMLANSDFFTGAFPAEYSNALSGVFDMNMRTGNSQKRESTFQAGLIGIDASSEGPFKKGGNASYLFNYRYSTLALLEPVLPPGANSLRYQDLSFKLNFPTKKAGVFSVWGIGLADKAGAKAKMDSTQWFYKTDKQTDDISLYMGAAGISHRCILKNRAYIKTTLAATTNGVIWTTQKLDQQLALQPQSKIANSNSNFVLSSFINKKVNARYTKKTGIIITGMMYDLLLNNKQSANGPPVEVVKAKGFSALISGYSSSSVDITKTLKMNLGITSQFFTLNNHNTIEPRVGLRQQMGKKQSIGFAYGLHSRLEKLNYYLNNSLSTGEVAVNKNLDFTKAHHFVLSYDWSISDVIHLRVEPYYQKLFSIPVVAGSSYSFINLKNDFFFSEKLQNTGEGKNYGVDVTFEKYLSKGFYYLLTTSLFNSEYKGGDGVWRSTRFNRNFVVNFLIGKEWQVGKNKQNVLSINTRFCYQGGARYTPVDYSASLLAKDIVYDETNAYKMQLQPTLNAYFTASYKINKMRSSREWALKIVNITGQPDFDGFKYNLITNKVEKDLSSVIIPNISYKIEF